MFAMILIVYIIFCAAAIAGGYFLSNAASKDEEMKFGLRTPQTQKSPDVWEYANRTLGRNWLKTGGIGLVLGVSAILLMYNYKGESAAKALAIVCLVFLVVILSSAVTSVMRDTYTKFDEDGRPTEL